MDAKPSSGRCASVPVGIGLVAAEMLASWQHGGAKQVSIALWNQGRMETAVHKTTLIRAARRESKEAGNSLVVRRGPPPRGLKSATMSKRVEFARNNRRRDWSNVMFTDRKKFHFKYPGKSVKAVRWELVGTARRTGEVWQPNKPSSFNVYGGITKHGVTKLHVVAGTTGHTSVFKTSSGKQARNITADEYRSVLQKTLLPGGKAFLGRNWVFQQDGDPAHGRVGAVLKSWNSASRPDVSLLQQWPGNSPDLNLIENVWAWVDRRVNEKGCSTFEEYKQEVCTQFAAYPRSMLTSLYNSMPKRLEEVMKNGGRRIKY